MNELGIAETAGESAAHRVESLLAAAWFKPGMLVLVLVYFCYLVLARAPASLAVVAAHRAAPQLWLGGVSGNLWQGVALSSQVTIDGKALALGELRWRIAPWSLLALRPCVTFSLQGAAPVASGSACYGITGSARLTDVALDLPLAAIAPLLPAPANGQLSLQVPSAELSGARVQQLDARLSWQGARVLVLGNWISFGSFAATAEADGEGGVSAKIFDLEGDFGVDLAAQWTAGAEPRVNGTISPRENAPTQVVQGLQVIAEEKPPGVFQVQWP